MGAFMLLSANRNAVSAMGFGAIGNGVADDTSAIQAAIDYAYANKIQAVYLPGGYTYKTSGPIYLDPPGNLRSSLSTPTIFNFSLALIGDEGLGNQEGVGTQIAPTSSNFVALWVGPGQGMAVKSITIIGPGSTHRALLSSSGCGIAIAGGSAGASRTLIENCCVANYYRGIATGFNGASALADDNTFIKCFVRNCFKGVDFTQAQNYINALYDCTISECTNAVVNVPTIPVHVVNGNYSTSSGSRKKFTIGTVSSFSTFSETLAGNSFTNYRFTAVVTSPDTLMNGAGYTACAVNTVGFGVVPLRLESFNTGTNTATFSLWPYWRFAMFGITFNVTSNSDLVAEVQAATTLYACEWITTFSGGEYDIRGVHFENALSLTTILSTVGSSTLEKCFFNYDITHSENSGNSGDDGSVWFCQQAFPFIINSNARIKLKDNNFGQTSPTESVTIDVGGPARMVLENNNLYSPNIRFCWGEANITGDDGLSAESKARGHGEYDFNPFVCQAEATGGAWANQHIKNRSINRGPMRGYRPDPKSNPRLTPAQITTLGGTLPAIGGYPLINGEVFHEVLEWNSGAVTHALARSAHKLYSYGQNLTAGAGNGQISGLSWSTKGQSAIVVINTAGLDRMFPGLYIILNNGTDGDQPYVVTEVHRALGYIVVTQATYDATDVLTLGAKTTTFTGTTIKQTAYTIAQYP